MDQQKPGLQSRALSRLPADFAQAAEGIQQAFLLRLESALTSSLETSATTTLLPSGQSDFEGFLKEHKSDGCVIALDLAPLNGCALLSFSREFLFKVLDIFTASPAAAAASPRETVTGIELHILQEVFDLFGKCLRESWQPIYPLTFDVIAVGMEKSGEAVLNQAAQIAVVLKSVVRVGEEDAGFEIALPGFLFRLADAKAKANSADAGAMEHVEENLLFALGESMLTVESVLNGPGIRMSELLRIRPGQILSLGTAPDAAFECLVNGKSRFKGEMLARGNRQAFRIAARTASPA